MVAEGEAWGRRGEREVENDEEEEKRNGGGREGQRVKRRTHCVSGPCEAPNTCVFGPTVEISCV